MTIPKRTEEVLEENSKKIIYLANTGQMEYKTGGTFQGLLVEAMSGPERIGYLTAEKRHDGNYVLDGVFVEEGYRNNGIATDMLRKAQSSVQMTPYITTENQIYQSEAGKKLAEKEYRMMTASTLVIAGPLAAIPELLAAGGEAAGAAAGAGAAGEAAAGGGGALSGLGGNVIKSLGIHSLLNSIRGPGVNSPQSQQNSDPAIETANPANPNFSVASKISTTVAWPEGTHVKRQTFSPSNNYQGINITDAIEAIGTAAIQYQKVKGLKEKHKALSPEAPTIEPMHMPETEPMTLPGHRTRRPKSIHTEKPKVEPATSIEVEPKKPASTDVTKGIEPLESPTVSSEKPETDELKGFSLPSFGGKLELIVPHTIVQSVDPAHPRFSSINDTRLIKLIGELYYASKDEWSPEDETSEEKVTDHDEWAKKTNHGEFRMPGKEKPLPPTTWE